MDRKSLEKDPRTGAWGPFSFTVPPGLLPNESGLMSQAGPIEKGDEAAVCDYHEDGYPVIPNPETAAEFRSSRPSGLAAIMPTDPPVVFSSSLPRPPTIELWDRERCARELRVAVGTLVHWGKKGPPSVKLGGRVWYRPEGVERWLKNREK